MDATANQVIGELERMVFESRHKRMLQLCSQIDEMEKYLGLALAIAVHADLRRQHSRSDRRTVVWPADCAAP